MAGGKNAETIVCPTCLLEHAEITPSQRVHEGIEVDRYQCEKGHVNAISWAGEELPSSPMWPATENDKEIAEAVKQALTEGLDKHSILQRLVDKKLL